MIPSTAVDEAAESAFKVFIPCLISCILMDMSAKIEIDCLGEMCPVPMIRLKKVLPSIESGDEVKLVCDHSCVVTSIGDFCRKKHYHLIVDEVMNGIWELVISRS